MAELLGHRASHDLISHLCMRFLETVQTVRSRTKPSSVSPAFDICRRHVTSVMSVRRSRSSKLGSRMHEGEEACGQNLHLMKPHMQTAMRLKQS